MRFSIITINYNHAEGLERTIKSVISQTCKDYEYIVIDGGSTDGSKDVILKYQEHISYWVSEPDGGIYNAMNKGTKVANGDYCIYMNSGDCFYEFDTLRKVMNCNGSESIIYGNIVINNIYIRAPEFLTLKVFYKSSIFHQATFIKRELIQSHPYDETLKLASDWKFFFETIILEDCSYRYIDIIVCDFESGGATDKNHKQSRREVFDTLKQHIPERILADYEDYCYGNSPFRRMMNMVEIIPPVKKIIFNIDRVLLKFINIKLNSEWIKEL